MGLFSGIFGQGTVAKSSIAPAAAAVVPQTDLVRVGGGEIDTSFLDALYAGGKVTAQQRDSLLAGSDPGAVGLNAYDLWNLTNGRLGSRTTQATCMPLILAWSLATAYQAGAVVTYQPPGAPAVGLYQAQQAVPAGTTPTTSGYWAQLVSPTAAPIAVYSDTGVYLVGQIVLYQPPGTQNMGLYQVKVALPSVGVPPTVSAFWQVLVSPGPVVLIDVDVQNPALGAIAAGGAGILGQDNVVGTVLPTIILPAGRRYRVTVTEVCPNANGGSTPTDCHFRLEALAAETVTNSGTALVITPRWVRIGTANNAAIAAVAALAFTARVRVELV